MYQKTHMPNRIRHIAKAVLSTWLILGAAGLKAIEPSGATFTGESGPLHLSFEVVLKSLLVFRDGIGRADW